MEKEKFIEDWLTASNNFDTEKYLEMYQNDAVLDDPSVGRKFIGHQGIKNYFDSFFIGYNTQTRLINLAVDKANNVHLEVEFTGDFPEGKVWGTFDFTFKEGKIAAAKADLI